MEDHWSCLLMYEAFPITNKFADQLYSPLIPTAQLFTTTKMRHTRAGNSINQWNLTPNCRSVWHVNQKVNSSDTKQFFLVTIYDTYQGVPWRRVCFEEAFRVPTALSPIGTCKLERFSFDLKKWFPWVFSFVLSAKRSRNHFLDFPNWNPHTFVFVPGCHGQGKVRGKRTFFKVREKSGKIFDIVKVSEKSGNSVSFL